MYHFTALDTGCGPVLLLHLYAGGQGARRLRRQIAGHFGQSGFRTRVPRADEYAGMAADLLPSLWLFAIYINDQVGRDRARLDQRPHLLHDRLLAGDRATRTGLPDSSGNMRGAPVRRAWRHCVAACARIRNEQRASLRAADGSQWRKRRNAITSSVGSRYPWPTGTPCRRARWRAACNSRTVSWSRPAS
jgi:hypothetical protein